MRYFSFGILFLLTLTFAGFSYAFTGCQTIVDANLGQTLTLEANIDGWSGNCFILNTTDDSNYLTIDCNNYSVDSNTASSRFFHQNAKAITTVSFRNCDINLDLSNNEFFYISKDINNINVLDSNIVMTTGYLFELFNLTLDQEIVFDFTGSNIDLSNHSEAFLFWNTKYTEVEVHNLDATFSSEDPSYYFLDLAETIPSSTDLNLAGFFDSNINIADGNAFFGNNLTIADSYLSFDFNNTDVNYLLFNDLNLNLTSFESTDTLLTFSDNSDINYVKFDGADLSWDTGVILELSGNTDSELDLNFGDESLNVTSDGKGILFNGSNYNTLTISNLVVDFNSSSRFFDSLNTNDLNSVNLFDSNLTFSNGSFWFFLNNQDDSIDFNFNNSTISFSSTGSIFSFSTNSDVTNLTITNLDDLTMSLSNNFILADATSDLNTVTVKNSSFTLPSTTDFFDYDATAEDTFLSFDFNNVDSNYLFFRDLNLNLTSFGSTNSFIKIDNNSDLNYFVFRPNAVNIDLNDGQLLAFTGNTNYDNVDFNFYGVPITLSGSAKGFNLSDGNYNTITITDLSLTSSSNDVFFNVDSNVANLDLLDSTVDVNAAPFYTANIGTFSNLDLNFSGSDIDVSEVGSFVFSFFSATYEDLNISNLTLTATDEEVFYVAATSIDNLNITDSNLSLDSFATVDALSNILGGVIYNNLIVDSNTSNDFITAGVGLFAADFNTTAQENATKRTVWLTADDSNYIGGNLYLSDHGGSNLYTTDSSTPYGIYDSTVTLLGSDENYTDSLALVAYTTPVTPNDSPGGGGGGSSSSYEFVAESSASDDNFYVGKEIKVTLKEADSIAIIPNVDINLTYPDGNVETIKTNASGYFEFTPASDGNYTFKYKTNKDKTTITVYSASLAPKETIVEPEPVVTPKTEPVKETPKKETTTEQSPIEDTNKETTEAQVEQEPFNWWYVWIPAIIIIIVLIILVFVVFKPKAPGQMF